MPGEDLLGAIAVMHVEIGYGHAMQAMRHQRAYPPDNFPWTALLVRELTKILFQL